MSKLVCCRLKPYGHDHRSDQDGNDDEFDICHEDHVEDDGHEGLESCERGNPARRPLAERGSYAGTTNPLCRHLNPTPQH